MRIILSEPAKSGTEDVHGLMEMITRTKTKNITIAKNKEYVIFSV